MTNTANLNLPYILPAQAQKHVTHNEALTALDALVHLSVLDNSLSIPPQNPNEGNRYIIAASPTGDWDERKNQIAAWQDGAWVYYAPQKGWISWVENQDGLFIFDGTDWVVASSVGGGDVTLTTLDDGTVKTLGVNADADTTNRLSVNSGAILFNKEVDDVQIKLNKQSSTDTASFLFQTNFSGRAEIGTAGDNDFHFKVSGDGVTWKEGLVIDADTGEVSFPNTPLVGGGASSSDTTLIALHASTAINAVAAISNGIADSFPTETGVDTAASTNEAYDATNKLYKPTTVSGAAPNYANAGGTGDRTASITISYSAGLFAQTTAGAADKLINGIIQTNLYFINNRNAAGEYLSFDFGTAKKITEFRWKQGGNAEHGIWKWQGSYDAATWTDLGSNFNFGGASTTAAPVQSISDNNAYRYFRLLGVSGTTKFPWLYEIEFKIGDVVGGASNADIQSVEFTAATVPDSADLSFLIKPIDAITPNIDIVGKVSRDDGTTWTMLTLVDEADTPDGLKLYTAKGADISAQPTGTSMKWMFETSNSKNIELHGAVLKWK